MTNSRDIIIKLKAVRLEKDLSYNDILALMEKNGDYLSRSTLSRLFREGSEDDTFDYENTIRPIAEAILDIDTIEETDDMDIQAMKTLLRYKRKRIEELEAMLEKEKLDGYRKVEEEREHSRKSIEFLKEQVAYKDKRIDMLLDSVHKKDELHTKMLAQILDCPCRKGGT